MPDFSCIVGHYNIVRSLKESIINDTVSHAYIFCGAEGIGKKIMSNCFAKSVNCLNVSEGDSCGKCRSCVQTESGNNPDVFYVKPVKTKSLGVDDIREQIIEKVKIKPYSYKHKIFIVDNADNMTVQAQNAILKTLEEPPEYVIIILIAENIESFIPTVLSRCVVIKFRALPSNLIKEYMIFKHGMSESEAMFYAEYCKGSIGEALRISNDEGFYQMREDTINCMTKIDSLNVAEAMLMVKDIEKYKSATLDIMYMFYRDVLFYRFFGDEKRVIQKDKINDIKEQALNTDIKTIAKRLTSIENAKKEQRSNANFQLSMEVLFINMKES